MGMLHGLELPVAQADEIAAFYLQINERTEDYVEGPRGFPEKRRPELEAR